MTTGPRLVSGARGPYRWYVPISSPSAITCPFNRRQQGGFVDARREIERRIESKKFEVIMCNPCPFGGAGPP